MESERVTATVAARSFSELLSRVRYRGEAFDIVRSGEVVARVVPPDSTRNSTLGRLLDALQRTRRPDDEFADDLEATQAEQELPAADPWAT